MSLFDAYIFVDWSSANRLGPPSPTRDAVWMGIYIPSLKKIREIYHPSRNDCITKLKDVLKIQIDAKRRVLVGFDFPYGYPVGLSNALNYSNDRQIWLSIWEEFYNRIKDTEDNINNRFNVASEINYIVNKGEPGPFWGCPKGKITDSLKSTSPGFPFKTGNETELNRLRIVESRLPGVQEAWKLFGAGSVGGQALVGIPWVYYLLTQCGLRQCSKVWPFETQFSHNVSPGKGPFILHAEIWPGVVKQITNAFIDIEPKLIQDQAQVRAMCLWAADKDRKNELGEFFDKPKKLDEDELKICIEQEGWILGAK